MRVRKLCGLPNAMFRLSAQKRMAATLTRLSDNKQPKEEETIQGYDASHFYPFQAGDRVASDRYSILVKLGWGRHSTVWLARDLRRSTHRYVAIKFNTCDAHQEASDHQKALYERMARADLSHRGAGVVRKTVDSFEVEADHGKHLCLVYEPLRETLDVYRMRFRGARLPMPLVKAFAKVLLAGLDFLHAECGITHTDLKLDNILMTFEDASFLSEKAEQLEQAEIFFKEGSHGHVVRSLDSFGPMKSYMSFPVIADLGLSETVEIGAQPVQPDAYRAPEVILGWGWSASADLWNLGNLIWTLASGRDLFAPTRSATGKYDPLEHLAQMIAAIGPPPPELIKMRSQTKWRWNPAMENSNGDLCDGAEAFHGGPFFDEASSILLHSVSSPKGLHELALFVPDEERSAFVDFMQKVLMWDPSRRSTAGQLFDHPWLSLVNPKSRSVST